MEVLEDRIVLALVTWTGPTVGGDFGTASDWSTGKLPGVADTAYIGSGNTVSFSGGDTSQVTALDVDGTLNVIGGNLSIGASAGSNFTVTTSGIVSGAGSIDVNNGTANTWSGGTMSGTGATTLASGSTLTLSGSSDVLGGGRTLGDLVPLRLRGS